MKRRLIDFSRTAAVYPLSLNRAPSRRQVFWVDPQMTQIGADGEKDKTRAVDLAALGAPRFDYRALALNLCSSVASADY